MATSQSLYREFRPQRFAEVLGQDHVVRALTNAVREGRVGHAYLFSGPRGTGKTSTARILAKALNCENLQDGEPCGVCASCVAVAAGTSFDVHEHDSASARGVGELKAILDTVLLGTPGRTKVYILDEVHMLTPQAVAALLKTLEEPPPNVVFVLATTDPQKVPETVRGRTQHFAFHLLPVDVLEDHVRHVAAQAGLVVDDEGVASVVREGRGSARDTLSALDRVAVGGYVDADDDTVDAIVEALAEQDTAAALTALARATANGQDARTLAGQLVTALRDGFLSLFAPDLVALPEQARADVTDRAQRIGRAGITRAIEAIGDILVEMRHAPDPRLLLDVVLVRLTRPEIDPSPAALVERLERLERRLAQGGGAPPDASSAPGPSSLRPAAPVRPAPEVAPRPAGPQSVVARPPSTEVPATEAPSVPATEAVPPEGTTQPAAGATEPAPAARAGGGVAAARAVLGSARSAAPAADVSRGRTAPGPTSPRPTSTRPSAAASASAAASPTGASDAASSAAPGDGPSPGAPAPPAASGPLDERPAPLPLATACSAAGGGHPPDRDQLTLAWADHVVTRLKPGTKGRFLAGRFVSAEDGLAVFALPNAVHRDKCEPLRGEVEQALTAHFGMPVRLKLVTEPDAGRAERPLFLDPDPDPEPVELHDLVDAPPTTVRTPLDHLTEAFPGARLVED